LYDIGPIKKVERSVKSDTISTNNSISKSQKNVNKKLSIPPATNAEPISAVETADISTRSALASALESMTQDEDEKRIISQYKEAVNDIMALSKIESVDFL
jgi:hypothetical protein